jgi:hypothetical protein
MSPGYGYGITSLISSSNSAATRGGGGGSPFANKYSLNFDGVDDLLTLASPMATSGTDWSVSCWIKTSQTGGNKTILSVTGGGSGASKYIKVNYNKLTFDSSDNSFDITSVLVVNDGAWHNIVFTYNYTSGAWILYIDGALDTSQTATTGIDIPNWNSFASRQGARFYSGSLDECAYFNTELSLSDIRALHNSGAPNDLTSLNPIAWYRNGDNGTWSTPQWLIPENSNVANSRVSNYSFVFDGVDDYIDVGTSLNLGINSTVSFWIKRNNVGVAEVFLGENSYAYDYLIYIETTNKLSIRIAGVFKVFGSASVVSIMNDTTNWINIVIVRSGDSIELFLNGASMGTNLGYGTVTDTRFDTIGAKFNGTFSTNANIDEVSAFNSALSGTDITSIYNGGEPTTITGALAHWRMGEDSVFTNNWLVDNSFSPNRALKFDNTYITSPPWSGYQGIAASISAISSDHITFSTWVKSTDSTSAQGHIFKTSLYDIRIYANRVYLFKAGAIYRYWAAPTLYNGSWHNVVIYIPNTTTWDLADAKIYVDDADLGAGTGINDGTGVAQITDIYGLFKTGAGGGGTITAEVSNWAYWLSDKRTDVSTIYNNGVPGDLSSLSPDVWWKLDSGTVTTDIQVDVIDSSGNGVTGSGPRNAAKTIPTLVASTVNSQPPYSTRSFNFDGVDDEINCGDVLHNDGQTPMTLSAWVNITNTGDHPIAGKKKRRQAPLYARRGWDVTIDTAGISANKLTFTLIGVDTGGSLIGNIQAKANGFAFTDGLWHHVVVTYDGSENASGVKFYVDGIEDTNTQILANTLSGNSPNDPTVDFKIGTKPEYSGSSFYDGDIDELAIWSTTALTQEQVTALYNGGVPDRIDGATSWWRMGEDATFNTNWNVPDNIGSATGTSANMTIEDLLGEAPNYTGGGLSNGMTIEDRVGDAPNSTSNAVSLNMDEVDRETDVPT